MLIFEVKHKEHANTKTPNMQTCDGKQEIFTINLSEVMSSGTKPQAVASFDGRG